MINNEILQKPTIVKYKLLALKLSQINFDIRKYENNNLLQFIITIDNLVI